MYKKIKGEDRAFIFLSFQNVVMQKQLEYYEFKGSFLLLVITSTPAKINFKTERGNCMKQMRTRLVKRQQGAS